MKSTLKRRDFLKTASIAGTGCLLGLRTCLYASGAPATEKHVVEARYYEQLGERKIKCTLCPHECQVADLERGTCGVRENRMGKYHTLVYGNPCSSHIDPIEKKPLFHYYPSTESLSVATAGCNFVCRFCQNWEISQKRPEQVKTMDLMPDRVIQLARSRGCRTVAHTYTEPVVFFEYMLACAEAGKRRVFPTS